MSSKGRKQRRTPLGRDTVSVLKAWLERDVSPQSDYVFPSSRGGPLSRDAIEDLVARHTRTAQQQSPSLKEKAIHPHVLRHTAAM